VALIVSSLPLRGSQFACLDQFPVPVIASQSIPHPSPPASIIRRISSQSRFWTPRSGGVGQSATMRVTSTVILVLALKAARMAALFGSSRSSVRSPWFHAPVSTYTERLCPSRVTPFVSL